MSQQKHKFIYFPLPGRGGAVRVALHAAGVDFEDVIINFADYGKAKAEGKYPLGLPVLETPSGKAYTQSIAQLRYAGKLGGTGLYPEDPEAALLVDEALDLLQDMLTMSPNSKDKEEKKRLREEYSAGKLKAMAKHMEEMIVGPFVLGDKISIADLHIQYLLLVLVQTGNFDYVPTDYLDQFPKITALSAAVKESEVYKKYNSKAGAV